MPYAILLAVNMRRRVVLAPPRKTSIFNNRCFGFSSAAHICFEKGGETALVAFGKNVCAKKSLSAAQSLISSGTEIFVFTMLPLGRDYTDRKALTFQVPVSASRAPNLTNLEVLVQRSTARELVHAPSDR